MVRKSTIIVVALFALAVTALLLLQNNPNSPLQPTATAVSTTAPSLLSGWDPNEVAQVEYRQADGSVIRLARSANGAWQYGDLGPAPQGKVEQMLAEMLAMRVISQLPATINLRDFLLDNPQQTITIKSAAGRTAIIRIGSMTATQSGYYIKVDENAAVVVGQSSLEIVLDLIKNAQPVTPTPETTPTPAS